MYCKRGSFSIVQLILVLDLKLKKMWKTKENNFLMEKVKLFFFLKYQCMRQLMCFQTNYAGDNIFTWTYVQHLDTLHKIALLNSRKKERALAFINVPQWPNKWFYFIFIIYFIEFYLPLGEIKSKCG